MKEMKKPHRRVQEGCRRPKKWEKRKTDSYRLDTGFWAEGCWRASIPQVNTWARLKIWEPLGSVASLVVGLQLSWDTCIGAASLNVWLSPIAFADRSPSTK